MTGVTNCENRSFTYGQKIIEPKFDSFHSLMKRMPSLFAQFFRFFVRKTYLTV
jgi:hypothetical protein